MTVKELKDILACYPEDMLVKYSEIDNWQETIAYYSLRENHILDRDTYLLLNI